jgi:CelD/BcsL family acetyltransferase involved in cellulose biosynthesis
MALLEGEIDALAGRCGAPATACGPWLSGTVAATSERHAWAVVVRGSDDELKAAVVLLDDVEAGTDVVTLAGSAMGHRSAILADSASAASLLGHAFAEAVRGRGRPVRVQLGPVDSDGRWLPEFTQMIAAAELVPVDAIPGVRREASANAADYLTSTMRRTLRKAENRATSDKRHLKARITTDEQEIAKLLPLIEELHRERDHAQGRRSELDDVEGLRIWRARITNLARHQVLELATLRIDGELAAHVLGIAELTAYRIVEGTLATRFARYAPGRVLEAAVLQRMLDDPIVDRLDWMTSVASERLLAANDAQPVSLVRVDLPADRD